MIGHPPSMPHRDATLARVSDVRTFHGRAGRLGPAAQQALVDHWPRFGVTFTDQMLDFDRLFDGRDVVVELGSGMGEATAEMAQADPDTGILAIEVHTAGVAALLRRIEDAQLVNVRVMHCDGVPVLQQMIAPDALAGVRLFFPDPWPKARHHKRRFVRPDLVHLVARRLAPEGLFHTATDWADYADQMLAVMSAEPLLVNRFDGFAPRPTWRPLTRFERKGLRQGHTVADLLFARRG